MNISIPSNLEVPPRTVLFRENDPAEKLYLIKRGSVLCLRQAGDRLVPIFLGKEEDLIGEDTLVPNSRHTYAAVSLSDTELVVIPNGMFSDVLAIAPEWLLELTKSLLGRFDEAAGLVALHGISHSSIIPAEDFTPDFEEELRSILL